jgi:hypothetical protein
VSAVRPFPAPTADPAVDLAAKALPDASPGPSCPGCGRGFVPSRVDQRHCCPSCRVAALRKRRAHLHVDSKMPGLHRTNEAADSGKESTADSRLRGNLTSRPSETS